MIKKLKDKIKKLEVDLITKENRIKERLCALEDKCKNELDYHLDEAMSGKSLPYPTPRKDGCYQFTYCNECMAFPMGLECPNIVKGPVCLKDEVKHPTDGEKSGADRGVQRDPLIRTPAQREGADSKPSVDNSKLNNIDYFINKWGRKIKDLQFSIEQFQDWKGELLNGN